WKIISADEVSQEIFQALVTHDFERLQALWLTDKELTGIDLSPAEVKRIRANQQQAAAKFQATCTKLNLTDKAKWVRLEAAPPPCVPAEQPGMRHDMIREQKGSILYEHNGKHDWVQTGEMIQVGLAWRLIDAPTPGEPGGVATGPGAGQTGIDLTPELQ